MSTCCGRSEGFWPVRIVWTGVFPQRSSYRCDAQFGAYLTQNNKHSRLASFFLASSTCYIRVQSRFALSCHLRHHLVHKISKQIYLYVQSLPKLASFICETLCIWIPCYNLCWLHLLAQESFLLTCLWCCSVAIIKLVENNNFLLDINKKSRSYS